MNEIIPSIIPNNLNIIKEKLEKVLGVAHKVQIDIVDGKYTEVKTWPFGDGQLEELDEILRGEEKFPFINDFIFEIDMFVFHPVEYLDRFISLGAKSFVIHVDSTEHLRESIDIIKSADCRVGLGIKPSIDNSVLDEFVPEIDFVQFMGNEKVGHNGIDLDKGIFKKIENFHNRHKSVQIQIDIGVNEDTIPDLKKVGVTSFVSSSSIFNSENPKEVIINFKNINN